MRKNTNSTIWLTSSIVILALAFLISCEDYQPVEPLDTNYDDIACDRLTGKLAEDFTLMDINFLGPQWSDETVDRAMAENERIGESWLDADSIITPDVFILKTVEGITSIFAFNSFFYNSSDAAFDSIEIHFQTHLVGSADFSADPIDTLWVLGSADEDKYIDFGVGLVPADSIWDIMISGAAVSLGEDTEVYRLQGISLLNYSDLPATAYFARDTLGFAVAYEYLESLNKELVELNTTFNIILPDVPEIKNSSYSLLNLEEALAGIYIFYADDFYSFSVFDTSGIEIVPTSYTIDMETVAECHLIKSRTIFEFSPQKYFVKFDPQETVEETEFRLSILRED
ncbi:MAG: hypothetical protein HQ556_08130 [Candidatus Marinimicrobia bacterium]|nr:hypothetical protein [Candidatus Neomarinimicrobiota bacterium]